MFSYIPSGYTDSAFYPQSVYHGVQPRRNVYSSPYGGILARKQEASRRAVAEQEARARLARGQYDCPNVEDDDEYQYPTYFRGDGLSPREVSYLRARRQREEQEAVEMQQERTRLLEQRKLVQEERLRRETEARLARERDMKAQMADLYRSLGLAQETEYHEEEAPQATSSRTPSQPPSHNTPLSPSRASTPPSDQTIACSTPPAPSKSFASNEEQAEAASKIQQAYRAHKSVRAILALDASFKMKRAEFSLPAIIDFVSTNGAIVSLQTSDPFSASFDSTTPVTVAKLAYTPANVPIRAYDEELSRLLTKLDAVESWGIKHVRERRREVVRRVESEAARVEEAWRAVWEKHVNGGKVEDAMEVDTVEQEEKPDIENQTSATAFPSTAETQVETSSSSSQGAVMVTDAESPVVTILSSSAPALSPEDTPLPDVTDEDSTTEDAMGMAESSFLPLSPSHTLNLGEGTTTEDVVVQDSLDSSSAESESENLSDDSDYESVGSVLEGDDSNFRDGEEEEKDFVML